MMKDTNLRKSNYYRESSVSKTHQAITFKEFEDLSKTHKNLIFPFNYQKISPNTVGIIVDNRFTQLSFSEEAKKSLYGEG